MFSHVFISVGYFDRSYALYVAVLESLGIGQRFYDPGNKLCVACHTPAPDAR